MNLPDTLAKLNKRIPELRKASHYHLYILVCISERLIEAFEKPSEPYPADIAGIIKVYIHLLTKVRELNREILQDFGENGTIKNRKAYNEIVEILQKISTDFSVHAQKRIGGKNGEDQMS